MDVSDAGGVFDLICEQLDGETLSAKGANRGGRKVFELTKIFQHRNGLSLLFSLETLQVFCFFSSGFCWSFRAVRCIKWLWLKDLYYENPRARKRFGAGMKSHGCKVHSWHESMSQKVQVVSMWFFGPLYNWDALGVFPVTPTNFMG